MYHETYVTIEQAQAMKRLGFNWECNHRYCCMLEIPSHVYPPANWNEHGGDMFFSAPALHVAQKWLREVKGIAINVIAHDNEWLRFKYSWNETYMQNCREKGKQWEEWSIQTKLSRRSSLQRTPASISIIRRTVT